MVWYFHRNRLLFTQIDTITIFYELNNPEYVIAKGSEYVFPGFLGFLGVVLLLIGKSMKNE